MGRTAHTMTTNDRQAIERLLKGLETDWIRHCQERMEERAAAAEYRRLGIPTEPYDPNTDDDL